MATFYFNGVIDSEWTTIGNWWMSFDGTNYSNQATVLPSSDDDVVVNGGVESNSGSPITILSLTMNDGYIQSQTEQDSIIIYVTNGTSLNGQTNITGPTTVNSDIVLYNSASIGCVVNGNITLNDTSYALGPFLQINGNVTFNDYSYFYTGISSSTNLVDIIGTATFNDYSYVQGDGLYASNAIFNDSSYVLSDLGGVKAIDSIIFNDYSYISDYGYAVSPDGTIIFNDDSHIQDDGSIVYSSLVTFKHNSYMTDNALIYDTVDNVIFNDNSMNRVGLGNNFILNRTTSPNGSSLLGIV